MSKPDFKQGKRIRDSTVMRDLHRRGGWCVICEKTTGLTLHHVLPKGPPHFGDDVEANLVFLCGSGTTGCHGEIENADKTARTALGLFLLENRQDVLEYLQGKLGRSAAREWLRRHLHVAAAWDTVEL